MDEDGKKSKKTSAYTYDLLGRITKEKKTGSEDISYTYDSNNNRKKMTVGNKVTAYKYNKNDELLRTDTLNIDTEKDSVVIYKNDKNGNQLATVNRYEIPSNKKDSSYVDIDVTLGDNRLNENVVNHYNALNQLTQTLTKNYKVSFTYDAEGLRTGKTVNGEKTFFVWDGDQLVLELSESGKVQKRYIRGNDLVYADKGTDTEKQYYVTDPHGNVVQLTDKSGKVTKTYEYDSFGNEVNPDSKDDNPFRYCGEYYDKETGEIYLRARYYQPAVGRFLTRDTYTGESDEPLSLHLYTYCGNDGVNAVDPSGHEVTDFLDFLMYIEKFVPTTKSARGVASRNFTYNKKNDVTHGIIYDQNHAKVKDMLYGESTIGKAGCELVAIYNVMKLKNKSVSFADIIYESDFSGYHISTGRLGTNPYKIGDILTEFSVKYSVIKKLSKLKRGSLNTYIISFWNKGGASQGIHTIAVRVMKEKIIAYNDGEDIGKLWKEKVLKNYYQKENLLLHIK